MKLFGGPGGYGYEVTFDWRDYGRRADLQRCSLHVDRDNPDAVAHQGARRRVTRRECGRGAELSPA